MFSIITALQDLSRQMEIVQDVIIESPSLDEREYHSDSAHDPGGTKKRSKEKKRDRGDKK